MPIRIDGAQVRALDGELHKELVGQSVRIVTRDTTTAFPIQNGAGDPIPGSDVTVLGTYEIPRIWIDTEDPADLYLDWLDVASGARGPVNFDVVLRDAAQSAAASGAALATAAAASADAAAETATEVAALHGWVEKGVSRRNIAADPRLTATTMTNGGATVADTRPTTGAPDARSYFRRLMTAANTSSPMTMPLSPSGTGALPVAAGSSYVVSAYARKSPAGGPAARIDWVWYDAAGVQVSTNTGAAYSATATWGRFSQVQTAPAGAVFGRPSLVWTGTALVDQVLEFAQAMVEVGTSATGYFDGNTPSTDPVGYGWEGAANASVSRRIDMRLVRSVNGVLPDASGNVVIQAGGGGVTNHSQLAGLVDGDPHTQYLTPGRGDRRYYPRGTVDSIGTAATAAAIEFARQRGNHTGEQGIGSITGLQEALDNAGGGAAGPDIPRLVIVSTGNEPRPEGAIVVQWYDGRDPSTDPPVNMGSNDVRILGSFSSGADLIAPSVPTGLTIGSITASGATLTWTASTDNVGVTGYEVRLDGSVSLGVNPTAPTATSRAITGLSQNTAHTVSVRARDAAGNWSAWSSAASFTTTASSDTTAPTVPTGLASSSITGSGFVVTWGAGTDNVGVTGYDVRVNGGAPETVPADPRSYTFTGFAALTLYTVEIRSRDAAGNVSPTWASIAVTTLEAAGETYSVYGAGAPTGTWALGTDGTPYIMFGRGFQCSSAGARVVGGRAWIPTAATGSVPTEVTFYLYGPNVGLGSTAVQTKVVASGGATPGSWVEALFDAPEAIETGEIWMIGVRFTGAGDAGKYVYAPNTRPNGDPIVSNGDLADELAWAGSINGALATAYKIGTGSPTAPGSYDQSYGVDILVDLEG